MAEKPLGRAGLKPEIVQKLSTHSVKTCQDLLSMNKLELLHILQVPYSHIEELLKTVSQICIPKRSTILELRSRREKNYVCTSLTKLDFVIKGGIPLGSVTEIAGPAGCGKTQFCFLMSIQATLPICENGLDGNVLYVDTESAFHPRRLLEIAQYRYPSLFSNSEKLHQLAQKVFVFSAMTCSTFKTILDKLEGEIISKNVKMVIVDSVASLIRKEFDMDDINARIERSNHLVQQASYLKYIAEMFHIPVIVTNQVTTRFSHHASSVPLSEDDLLESGTAEVGNDGGGSESGYVTSALGNTWSHCVNTRLIIQYHHENETWRQILIAKSPVAPFASFICKIATEGIILEDEEGYVFDGTDPGRIKIQTRSFHHFTQGGADSTSLK